MNLQDFSTALADATEHAAQFVARVEARRRMPASGILWSDGLIVTAHHIVERDDNLRVGLPDGTSADAELVGRDPSTDIAVLRIQTSFKGITAADDAPRVGNFVLAVGRPGENAQVSFGVISALSSRSPRRGFGRPHHGPHNGPHRPHRRGGGFRFGPPHMGMGMPDGAIHSDVIMFPGFSGGPLINASGQLIGMNTSAIASGSSLALPVSSITRVVEQLTTHGRMRRGFLGLSVQPMRLSESLAASVDQGTGLLIVSTESDGPAEAAGLYQGDIIFSLDDTPTRSLEDLLALLSGDRVGTTVPVKIIRGGQIHQSTITIAERH